MSKLFKSEEIKYIKKLINEIAKNSMNDNKHTQQLFS